MKIKLVPPEKGSDCGHYTCMKNFDYNTVVNAVIDSKYGALVLGSLLIQGGANLPLHLAKYKYIIGQYLVVEQ